MRSLSHVRKEVLSNGLRVVVQRQTGASRTAVCVHYGVGFRSETVGQEGIAHLLEHAMFGGSENVPKGHFFEHLRRMGGRGSGTTHQDYTDYHQIVPAVGLEQALFSEADRMRAPRFTSEALAEQLEGIEREVRKAVKERPYGGLPLPVLPWVMYRWFANAHDAYGDVERLRRSTPDDCAEFFHDHYAPGNAVVTVVGDHDPDEVLAMVEHHFGDVPPRRYAGWPDLDEPEPASDRWETGTEPSVPATAVTIGYRLPDPSTDLAGYLAHMVLARMVGQHGIGAADVPVATASCGFFGPLDAHHPDTLVVSTFAPPRVGAEYVAGAVANRWAAWGDGREVGDGYATAVRRLVADHHRAHADPYPRCRAFGRLELLFGRAELLDELPGRLAVVTPDEVAAAARRLRSATRAVVEVTPGSTRTRPTPRYESPSTRTRPTPRYESPSHPDRMYRVRSDPPAGNGSLPGGTRPSRPRSMPPASRPGAPRFGPLADLRQGDGVRVIAVRDPRAPLVELRLRMPLGPAGWRSPASVAALVRHLAHRTGVAARAEELGGDLQLASDGEWFDATGYAPSDRLGAWLALLEPLFAPVEDVLVAEQASVHRLLSQPDLIRVMDEALRRHWSEGLPPAPPAGESGPAAVHRQLRDQRRFWLVAVGDLDPDGFTALAGGAARSWRPPVTRAEGALPAGGAAPPDDGAIVTVPVDGVTGAYLSRSATEPADRFTEAARYLATTVVGGFPRSRLDTRLVRDSLACETLAGRDVCRGVRRAYVRARVTDLGAVRPLRDELQALVERPVTAAETADACRYCSAQLLAAFDSPASKADTLRQWVSADRDPGWLEQLPRLMRELVPADVAAAARDLFGPDRLTSVVAGSRDAVAAVARLLTDSGVGARW